MSRFYGGDNTIHQTEQLQVEVSNGRVVSVWFRCQMLPFEQVDVGGSRVDEMTDNPYPTTVRLIGVQLETS